jgi:hypothetical protein
MNTDRQKSFIATLGTQGSLLHFLDVIHGECVYTTSTMASGGFFTGRRQKKDHSHFLGVGSEAPKNSAGPLTLYFRHTQFGYTIYIRSAGQYFGKCLGSDEEGLIGAVAPDKSVTFKLLNTHCKAINPESMKKGTTRIYLQARDSGLIHAHKIHNAKHTYIANKGGMPLPLILNMIESNAPDINHPDEL